MRVTRLNDASAVARAAADLLCEAVAAQPTLTLGLPTGRTMVPFYRELARRHRSAELDLSRATAFNLDELLIPTEHPASFARYMRRNAWGRIGLDPDMCEIPRSGDDPAAECRRYDEILADSAPLDLVFLGIGADGHVAYNLPGTPQYKTHVVQLPQATAVSLGISQEVRPLRAITMGFGPLLEARQLALLATTEEKQSAVRRLLDGTSDPAWPCTLLLAHPRVRLLLTPRAEAKPSGKPAPAGVGKECR